MKKFETFSGVAVPFPGHNIDTDRIIPARFLKTIKRTGLGVNLFNDIRYNEDGSEKEDFVLNQPAYRKSEVLVAGDNFGCGSSREHAPWALTDFGIRCVISSRVTVTQWVTQSLYYCILVRYYISNIWNYEKKVEEKMVYTIFL